MPASKKIEFSLMTMAMVSLLAGACTRPKHDKEHQVRFATAVMQDVLPGLVKALQDRVNSEGAAKAVVFCNEFAAQFGKNKVAEWATKARSELGATNFRFQRISALPRNPKNAPSDAQAQILATWARDGATPTHYEHEGRHFTMHPIKITQPLCLSCHGITGTADRAAMAAVKKLYPEDKATGYKLGDLRGAFITETEFAVP